MKPFMFIWRFVVLGLFVLVALIPSSVTTCEAGVSGDNCYPLHEVLTIMLGAGLGFFWLIVGDVFVKWKDFIWGIGVGSLISQSNSPSILGEHIVATIIFWIIGVLWLISPMLIWVYKRFVRTT